MCTYRLRKNASFLAPNSYEIEDKGLDAIFNYFWTIRSLEIRNHLLWT